MRSSPGSTIPDEEIRYEAVWAGGNGEIDGTWPYVSALLIAPDTDRELLLAAFEAAVSINPHEAKPLLAELTDSQDTDIAEAADSAMMMAATPFDDAFDDQSELWHEPASVSPLYTANPTAVRWRSQLRTNGPAPGPRTALWLIARHRRADSTSR